MSKSGKIVIYATLWVMVIGFVWFFLGRVKLHYAQTKVSVVDIRITGASQGNLFVKADDVKQWLAADSVPTLGVPLDKLNIPLINSVITSHDYVSKVSVQKCFDGRLIIDVVQRIPLVRFMCEGHDCYITTDGYVVHIQKPTLLYLPVVSGDYQPPFPPNYTSSIKHYTDSLSQINQREIKFLEQQKQPLYQKKQALQRRRKDIAAMKVTPYEDESAADFERRVDHKREEKRRLQREVTYQERLLDEELLSIESKQEQERKEQKKLLKRYEDFSKLINFVEYIEKDKFWKSEIVQIEAYSTSSGDLALHLIPRSGDFVIEFGAPVEVGSKFQRLRRFYRDGLSNMEWDRFTKISVVYPDKVICTSREDKENK